MKSKKTLKALLASVLALVMCFSMLVGTTFAWFTDTVTTDMNQIIAGNLDIELYNALASAVDDTNKIGTTTKLFEEVALWEPGAVAVENFTVANVGTLALKYQLSVNFENENTVDGYGLSDILKVAVIKDGTAITDRDTLIASIAESEWAPLASFEQEGKLLPEDRVIPNAPADAVEGSETYGIVIYWEPSSEDNNWNVNNGKTTSNGDPLQIELGITLVATQLMAEDDSFDNTYDEDAEYPVFVGNADELKDALADPAISEIRLTDNIAENIEIGDISNKSIDADGKNVSLKFTGAIDNVIISGIEDNDDATPAITITGSASGDITIQDSYLYDASSTPYGAIAANGSSTNLSVTIDNCELTGARPAYFTNLNNLVITDSTFNGVAGGSWAILVNGTVIGDVIVDKCTFDGSIGVLKAGVGGGGNSGTIEGNLIFTNNILTDCTLKNGGLFETKTQGTITKTGNTVNNEDTLGVDWDYKMN